MRIPSFSEIRNFAQNHLKHLRMNLRLILAMYFALLDPATPLPAKAAMAATLAYVLSPLDAIPDMLPGGFADDIALLITFTSSFAALYIRPDHLRQADQILARFGSPFSTPHQARP